MTASRSYVRDVLRLAGPVALARLGIIGMGLVDVIVVGQLAADELPYQALGWAPTAVFLVAAIGLLQGVQVLAARSLGEGNPQGAGVALRRGLVLGLIAGLISAGLMWLGGERLFTTFGISEELAGPSTTIMAIFAISIPLHLLYVAGTFFLEAIKKPGISTGIMWAANAVNLALNLWWVPEYGAVGSAWATVGARVFLAGVILLWIYVLLRDRKHYGVGAKNAVGPSYRALLGVGIAAAVSQAVEAGAFSAMTVIAGRLGADFVSAYQIVLNIMALVFMVALGVGAASAVLVSEAIGRQAPQDAARAGWTGIGINAVVMIVAAVAILVFAEPIGRGYTADLAIAGLVASLMWVAALVLHPDGAQVVIASVLRARGDNWFPTFSHIAAYAVVMPVLGFWLAEHQGMGVAGLLFAIFWASVLSAAVLLLRWWALARKLPKPTDAA
ncbi:MAG: MATE family efflux transporter [Hyphomonadaceae bacterium]|nr:MATE family efflux transporter [Hyphomonadaceae bacterium]